MARTATLAVLRAQVRERADMQSTSAQAFVTDAEINRYISQSNTEFYDMLVSAGGQEYFMTSAALTVNVTTGIASLPADFYRVMGVDAGLGSNQAVTLQAFNFNERNLFKSAYGGGWGLAYNLRYRVIGASSIEFIPVPPSTLTFTLWYVPVCQTMIADSDVVDGVDGWEELLVTDAAIKCLIKEESDVSVLMARKAELVARVMAYSPYRNQASAERVRDADVELLTAWPWC